MVAPFDVFYFFFYVFSQFFAGWLNYPRLQLADRGVAHCIWFLFVNTIAVSHFKFPGAIIVPELEVYAEMIKLRLAVYVFFNSGKG